MSISFNGYGENIITFNTGKVTQGYPVAVSAEKTVSNSAANVDFIGIAYSTNESITAVKTDGYVELPYTSTPPTVGYSRLVSNGTGGVKVNENAGKSYKVLFVDAVNAVVGFML